MNKEEGTRLIPILLCAFWRIWVPSNHPSFLFSLVLYCFSIFKIGTRKSGSVVPVTVRRPASVKNIHSCEAGFSRWEVAASVIAEKRCKSKIPEK